MHFATPIWCKLFTWSALNRRFASPVHTWTQPPPPPEKSKKRPPPPYKAPYSPKKLKRRSPGLLGSFTYGPLCENFLSLQFTLRGISHPPCPNSVPFLEWPEWCRLRGSRRRRTFGVCQPVPPPPSERRTEGCDCQSLAWKNVKFICFA